MTVSHAEDEIRCELYLKRGRLLYISCNVCELLFFFNQKTAYDRRISDWVSDVCSSDLMSEYYAPKNFNIWYYFGSLAMLVLVNQLITGIWLTMFYKPSAAEAFGSVEYIMRDVQWGWLIRYMHSTGASAFFIVVYLHMFRGLIYGSSDRKSVV